VARYFSHEEIIGRQLPATRDIAWVAGEIAKLAPFQAGSAVLCGSVAWGTHSNRSDIDIAHFGTVAHPQIEPIVREVIARYEQLTQGEVIAPRVDVITIGVEAEVASTDAPQSTSNLDDKAETVDGSSNGTLAVNERRATIFEDTFVRFTDHIGALAHANGDVWKKFLDDHLVPSRKNAPEVLREATRSYVAGITSVWAAQPLHPFNLDANRQLTQRQLDLTGQAENYPVNLMRRLLSAVGRYPRPDRISDIRKVFEQLPQPWAQRLLTEAAPFFALGAQYEALIVEVRQTAGGLTPENYYERLSNLFGALPFDRIQDVAWEFLDSR